MEIVKFFNELLKLMESLKGTPWEIIIPTILFLPVLLLHLLHLTFLPNHSLLVFPI